VTRKTVEKRWCEHVKAANAAKCGRLPKFHSAIRKYGSECWTHELLEQHSDLKEASSAEIRLVNFYDSHKNGYNSTPGGMYRVTYVATSQQLERNCGPNHKNSKLSFEKVIELKRSFLAGKLQLELAELFSVTQSTISRILSKKTHKNVLLDKQLEDQISSMLFAHFHRINTVIKDSTRLKLSQKLSGKNNGMFGKKGKLSPLLGTKRSAKTCLLMSEKAKSRERQKRVMKATQ
jgi:hypothetical protein